MRLSRGFGGKSRVASLVWERFGDVPNYVEPFFGSGAVLLGRPHAFGIETVNDLDCYVANFWRALQTEPDAVACHADWPVNEADQHARHLWLVKQSEFRERLKTDPDWYDVKIAGWWVWGLSMWIGSGWCQSAYTSDKNQRPHLGSAGQGVHRQRPHLRGAGQAHLIEYMTGLADRLRRVRVCCGDWTRICGPTPTVKQGVTGVFLDPPYSDDARYTTLYGVESMTVAHAVREWAIEHGDDPLMRIALCGYEGEHTMPETWECVAWKTLGGYGNQGSQGSINAVKERIWFSPHCLPAQRVQLEFPL